MKETLNAINETLNRFSSNFICFHVNRAREVNVVESILDVEGKLEAISRDLSRIRNALERIANAVENKDALSASFKVERCFDPSDGPFVSQEPEEPEGFADIE